MRHALVYRPFLYLFFKAANNGICEFLANIFHFLKILLFIYKNCSFKLMFVLLILTKE
jgi:hypothetical protein